MRRTSYFLTVCFISAVQTTFGSQDTIGTNGINAFATGLTGRGVSIGQVETDRPGRFGAIAGFDDAAHSDPTITPAGVAVLDDFTPPPNMNIDDHAEYDASVMISSSTAIPGVARQALLYASAYAEPIDGATRCGLCCSTCRDSISRRCSGH